METQIPGYEVSSYNKMDEKGVLRIFHGESVHRYNKDSDQSYKLTSN